MVTITIISLLAAVSVPALQKVQRRTVAATVANDLRVFEQAFNVYAQETGKWPAEVDAGVFPPEMASRINQTAWQRPTPIGGQYNWDNSQMHNGVRVQAAIAISTTSVSTLVLDVDLLEEIDRLIDDGNLSTGKFVIGAEGEPAYIITP